MAQKGIESIAIVLVNSYMYNVHEKTIKAICLDPSYSFKNISVSHEIMNTIKLVNRGSTTTVDAYLNPHIMYYLNKFQQGFINAHNTQVFFM
jgi:N-methylhydantoinase A/oxoprolinase/acetone carboxylase beta subunit